MIVIRRIIPFLTALLLIGAFEFVVLYPQGWYYAVAAVCVAVIFSCEFLQKHRTWASVFGFLVAPLFLNLGSFAVLLVLQENWLSQGLIVLTILATTLYLEHLFTFYFLPDRYKSNALENVSFPMNMLTVFLLSTGCSAAWALVHVPSYYLAAGFFFVSLLLSWQFFWVSKVSMKKARWGILFSAVMVTELFWVLAYLPLSFYVVGMLIVALYYLVLNLSRFSTLDSLGSNIVKRTVLLVAIIVISVLVTARWM